MTIFADMETGLKPIKCVLYAALLAACMGCGKGTRQNSYLKSFGYLGPGAGNMATLTGQVREEEQDKERPVSGANIIIGGQTLTTDDKGAFTASLKPGRYDIAIHKPGFSDLMLKGYDADSNEHADAHIMLCPGKEHYEFRVGKNKIKSANHLK